MQENETRLDNMSMALFIILIMFRSVGRCREMSYTMIHKEGPKSKEFTPIISVKCLNGGGEIIFNKLLEGNKG